MKNTNYDIITVGAGAAGLASAISAKRNNRDLKIAILEAQSKAGKKILVTGNGRCNLTNINVSKEFYHGSFDVSKTLNRFSAEKLINFFSTLGLVCDTETNGLVYPHSRQASAVLDVLLMEIKRLKIEIICDCKVELIRKKGEFFNIKTSNGEYTAKKVVMSCGGKAFSTAGGTGLGLDVIKNLGHKITPLFPALCPIQVKSDFMKSLKGIRAKAEVTLYDGEKAIKSEIGEVQFTDNALSGICVFNLTTLLPKTKNPIISVNLTKDYSYIELLNLLYDRKKLFANEPLEEFFTGLFHKKIGTALIKSITNKALTENCKKLSDKELKSLANLIQNWKFECKQCKDFSKAQVMLGGVNGNEVNGYTFESKVVKNLYICGEALDVCGDCGGFNLHFAFASGIITGENL
ncbi:NAD(P)/FAD-dependent oxidoreductase [Ruminococcus intestinalis]|uniref:NAD(P)/FAD-dependent oxidoreductase n=1 Tax=Ruminococcus intestinalis TaxID=2763066 RepID=UPI003F81E83C